MSELTYSFAGLVIILNALAELVKRTPVYPKVEAWYPIVIEVGGFGLGMVAGQDWFTSLLIGLSAMGIFDVSKASVRRLRDLS